MLGRHCLAIVAILLAACSPSGGDAVFAEQVAGQVRRELGDQATVRVSAPRTLEVRFADGTSLTASLDNLGRDCELRPADCEAAIAIVVRSIAQSHVAVGTGRRETLMVTVKSRDWVDNARTLGAPPVARPFVGDLWKVYVFDQPDSMRPLVAKDLEALKMTEDEIDALALANLDKALVDFPHQPVEEGSPVRVLHAGDSYDASRLLLHERWRELAGKVKGDLLVCAPSRDFVYFVGAGESSEVLQDFRSRMAGLASGESHSIALHILRWTPAGWVVEPG